MDWDSVTRAFEIAPQANGDFVWVDVQTLHFTPSRPWTRGTQYQVTINERASNTEGTALIEPVSFDFTTVGFVKVRDVQPAPNSKEIDPDTSVTVSFNRPIVPLLAPQQRDALPAPLSFDPPVEGEGEWLNTAVYRFRATDGFRPATSYTARIAGGWLTRATSSLWRRSRRSTGASSLRGNMSSRQWDIRCITPRSSDAVMVESLRYPVIEARQLKGSRTEQSM